MTPRYRIEFTPGADRQFRKLDPQVRRRLAPHIGALSTNPRPPGMKMLVGHHGRMRIRVGHWRIVYTIHDDVLLVQVIGAGHRGDVYR